MSDQQESQESQETQETQTTQPQPQEQPQSGSSDAQENKVMGIFSYIPFFCLIPLFTGAHKKSEFVKYHLNQGIILFIVWVGYWIINAILRAVVKVPVKLKGAWGELVSELGGDTTMYYRTPGWLGTILWLISVGLSVLCIIGIWNALKERCQPLPLIGKYTIIK